MNRNVIISAVTGLLIGLFVMGFAGFNSSPADTSMMIEDESRYDFDKTIEVFEKQVSEAGWSIITVHNMSETLNQHGHNVDEVMVFELCSARYSAEILRHDDERIISPLMPCRVAIYKKSDGNTYISRMDNEAFARPFGGVIHEVMTQAAADIEDIIAEVI